MNANPILQPLVVYGALTFTLMAAGLLFVWTKLHFQALERRLLNRQSAAERAATQLREAFDQLRGEVASMERQAVEASGAPPARGLNLSKRSHALRMHRRGDTPEQIAAALQVPRQEVELLLAVHRIVIAAI